MLEKRHLLSQEPGAFACALYLRRLCAELNPPSPRPQDGDGAGDAGNWGGDDGGFDDGGGFDGGDDFGGGGD